jgi:hypothetical protein
MRATRRQALLAVAAGPVLLAAPSALAASDEEKQREQNSLAQVLRLEQMAVVAFEAIANSGRLSGRATALFRELLGDDRQHADVVAQALDALGVKPPIPPRRAKVPGLAAVRNDRDAASFAIALEERTIGAYVVAVRDITDGNLLHTVAGAMGTDGQHLVVLRQLAGGAPVPAAFERGAHP